MQADFAVTWHTVHKQFVFLSYLQKPCQEYLKMILEMFLIWRPVYFFPLPNSSYFSSDIQKSHSSLISASFVYARLETGCIMWLGMAGGGLASTQVSAQ